MHFRGSCLKQNTYLRVRSQANDLVPMDTNGSSDPYIILRFGKTQHKTRVAKRSLSPIYGEDFIFEDGKVRFCLLSHLSDPLKTVSSFIVQSTLLRLEVFDYDLFSEVLLEHNV